MERDGDGAENDLDGLDGSRGTGVLVEQGEVAVERGHACVLAWKGERWFYSLGSSCTANLSVPSSRTEKEAKNKKDKMKQK